MRLPDRVALWRPVLALGRYRTGWHGIRSHRRARPWLAMVAVPLAMNATGLTELWPAWLPLAACAWWWADGSYRWTWVVAIQEGTVGTGWAYAGAVNLGALPDHRPVVIGVWLGYAVAFATASILTRRYGHSRHYGGPR